jgi:membrane protease subunit HflK
LKTFCAARQDRLQQLLPGGYFSGVGIALLLLAAIAIWGDVRILSRSVRRTRRRAALRQACPRWWPGLNYHLPYPIETVLLPKALRVSTLSIGMT